MQNQKYKTNTIDEIYNKFSEHCMNQKWVVKTDDNFKKFPCKFKTCFYKKKYYSNSFCKILNYYIYFFLFFFRPKLERHV